MSSPVPPDPPTATVVVCAYTLDRWRDIVDGVQALATQTRRPDEVVVVIDHNPELLARAREHFPEATVVPNDRAKGLSGARNTAIDLASGDVVVFLDDDATPEPVWLERLLEAYDGGSATAPVLAVGGSASPRWPDGVRPAQLVPELDWIVGCTYTGQPGTLAPVRNLMGCNMSFRREVFEEVGGFDEGAGRIGTIPLGCEETELCIRLGQRRPDAQILFEPAARVHHRVSADRVGWAYLRSRSLAEGLSKAAMAKLVGAGDATSTERDYVRRVLTAGVRRELGRALHGDADGVRGAAGIVTALGATSFGYARGRVGGGSKLARSAEQHRAAR